MSKNETGQVSEPTTTGPFHTEGAGSDPFPDVPVVINTTTVDGNR